MAVTLEGVYKLIDRASPALDRIERKASAADRALEKLGRTMDKVEARNMASKLATTNTQLGKMEQQTSKVERATRAATTSQRGMNSELDKTSSKSRKAQSDLSGFEKVMRKVILTTAGLGKVLAPAKFLAIGAAIAPVSKMLQAVSAGAIGLVQQVGQATAAVIPLAARMADLAGAGVAAVTALLSIKTASLVVKFALSGVKQAIDGNKNALKGLTPQARAFVQEMKKLKPVLDTIRNTAQKGLFPGLTGAIKTARANGAAQFANQAAGGIGSAVGGVAQSAAQKLLSPSSLRDLASISATMQVVITRLGAAAISLAGAFRSILVVGEPLTRWLTSAIQSWADYVGKQVQAARYTGQLASYFSRTRAALTNVSHAVRDFGRGFLTIMGVARGQTAAFGSGIAGVAKTFRDWTASFQHQAEIGLYFDRARISAHTLGSILLSTVRIFSGVGKAADGLGHSLTTGIAGSLKGVADSVNSFTGQNRLNRWFNNARSTLGLLWKIISDVSGAFIRLGQNGAGANSLLVNIDKLIPDLERVLRSFATNIGPGLFGTITQLVHLLSTLASSGSSPLGQILNATSGILTTVNSILDRFQGVRAAAATAITVIGGALLIQKLRRIVGGVEGIRQKWMQVTSATNTATAAVVRQAAVVEGEQLATGGGLVPGAQGGGRFGYRPSQVPESTTGGIPAVLPASEEAAAARRGGLRGLLGRPGVGIGASIVAPIVANAGLGALQSSGVIGGHTASNVGNVVNMASTGAIAGSFIGPEGTVIGGALGAGAGLLGNAFSNSGPSATARYLASVGHTASKQGFDITQSQGGATTLAGANRYQKVLDQSLTRLRTERAALAPIAAQNRMFGGQLAALDQQIKAARTLRGENLDRLGQERKTQKALEAQTKALQAQARARSGRAEATSLVTQYARAINIDQTKGHMTLPQAVHTEVGNIQTRIRNAKNPAFARALGGQTLTMLASLKKTHPEIAKEYDALSKTIEQKMGKLGTKVTVQSGKILSVTGKVWNGLKSTLANPIQVAFSTAAQQAGTGMTALQTQMVSFLVASGLSRPAAVAALAKMLSGGAGPTGASIDARVNGGGAAAPSFAALTAPPAGFASGGRIPGAGLADTVPIGGMAAPGELIVNRHTEARANRVLGAAGTSLGSLVAGETRKHSDILPGFAMGGRVSAAVGEANRINALHSKYLFGGGHVTPAPSSPPWDCSSATSRVLQAAGYNIPTMTAKQFMSWGKPGPGAIGVEASPGHVYMMLNGKPWGTSYSNPGGGAGWINNGTTYRPGFVKRHAPNAGAGAKGAGMGGGGFLPQLAMMGALNSTAFGSGTGPLLTGTLGFGSQIASGFQGTMNAAVRKVNRSRAGGVGGAGLPGGGSGSQNQTLARAMMMQSGWGAGQWPALQSLWNRESGFSTTAKNASSGAYGIPQSLPASKMASAGADYLTNPRTQIAWGLNYIRGRYGSPDGAWAHSQATNPHWYAKGGRTPAWGGWHAGGLDRTFDKPTVIGVGEAGRERVTVTPSRSGSGARSVSIDVSGGIHIHGGSNASAQDIRREIDMALEELARRIESQSLEAAE